MELAVNKIVTISVLLLPHILLAIDARTRTTRVNDSWCKVCSMSLILFSKESPETTESLRSLKKLSFSPSGDTLPQISFKNSSKKLNTFFSHAKIILVLAQTSMYLRRFCPGPWTYPRDTILKVHSLYLLKPAFDHFGKLRTRRRKNGSRETNSPDADAKEHIGSFIRVPTAF